jgi:hypothetical protein
MTILVPPVNERTSRAAKASAAKTMRNAAHGSGLTGYINIQPHNSQLSEPAEAPVWVIFAMVTTRRKRICCARF